MTIRNLEFVLRPRSIAVIGASNDAASVGRKLTENVLNGGFSGPVYLVNPKHRRVAGQDSFLSIDELPETPDLAVIATPPETIPSLIAAIGEKGTRAAVVITAGIGQELRQAMLNAARPTCLRIADEPLNRYPGRLALATLSDLDREHRCEPAAGCPEICGLPLVKSRSDEQDLAVISV